MIVLFLIMTNEETVKHRNRKRIVNYFLLFLFFMGIEIVEFSFIPLFHIAYIPTIVNGFITAMSILVAVTVFSLTHVQPKAVNKTAKVEYSKFTRKYLFILFLKPQQNNEYEMTMKLN